MATTSAQTDGADVVAAAVTPVSNTVDLSGAATDGADVLTASLLPVVGMSSALVEGIDQLDWLIVGADPTSSGAAGPMKDWSLIEARRAAMVKNNADLVIRQAQAAARKALHNIHEEDLAILVSAVF